MKPWMLQAMAVGCLLTAASDVAQRQAGDASLSGVTAGTGSTSGPTGGSSFESTSTGPRLPSKSRGLREDESYATRMKEASTGTATVIGQVNRPGPVALRGSDTLRSVISKAGDMTDFGFPKKIRVNRRGEVINLNLTVPEGQSFKVEDGDIVTVPERIF
ncbi:hypothetical protein OKA04_21225 [Luteolibacter flavescens]|uniref:SLBB domain-containing protein n=1 Tax=Luteolibacter flavescens TaxID=1859460 RepID=A0ABT3FUK3_9BACT|nr:hypothetical protein [Luteolibacter flavescens]MCW1887274.1 hypothetical protein [Luteolibacter flavescens]